MHTGCAGNISIIYVYLDDTLYVHLSRSQTGGLVDSKRHTEVRSNESYRKLAVVQSNCAQSDYGQSSYMQQSVIYY